MGFAEDLLRDSTGTENDMRWRSAPLPPRGKRLALRAKGMASPLHQIPIYISQNALKNQGAP